MDDAIGAALDHAFFDDLADALSGLAGEVGGLPRGCARRSIRPTTLQARWWTCLVDRIEDLLRDAFGATVGIRVRFTLHGLFDVDFDLGTVGVRTSDLVHAIRGFARGLNAVTSAAHELAQALVSYLGLEQQLDLAEVERDNARAQRSDADALAREARMTGSLQILQPGAAAAYGGDIAVEIALMDVPRSFLGVDAHVPARIQVFVDETPVALSSFDVVEGVPGRPANALARLDGPVTAANPLLGRSLAPARARQSSIWTPAPSTQARVPEHAKRAVGRVSNVGTRPVSAVIHAATPGRRPRPSVTGKLVAEAQPAFTLRTVIVARDIGEGFHTLTVTLTTGSRSSRVSQSVAFYVGAAAAAPRVPSGGRAPMGKLPTRPAFPADQFAPALRPLVPKPLVPLPHPASRRHRRRDWFAQPPRPRSRGPAKRSLPKRPRNRRRRVRFARA
jgi:hypothetical protein